MCGALFCVEHMKFSIVMPVLNGARFMESAIASVLAQTHDDWELIIMDGGSDDGSADIATRHAQEERRITFFSQPDKGIYDAVLNGFAQSSGDWFSWLNSDDLYAPWCLAAVERFVRDEKSDWVTGGPGCWDGAGRLRYVRPSGLYPQRLIRAGWFHEGLLGHLQQESMFFSRKLFDRLGPDDIGRVRAMRYAGDFLLWRLLAEHAPLDVAPTVLGGFRRHQENRSTAMRDAYLHEVRQTQPFTAPGPVAGVIAVAYRVLSSWAMMRAAARADQAVMEEVKSGAARPVSDGKP